MKRFFWAFVLYVSAGVASAQVGVVSVTEEDKHANKEDFYHTFEYQQSPLNGVGQWKKCQATRIGRRWFATAAHCVQQCARTGCRIYMDLLDEPISVFALLDSTPKKPAVFLHPEYRKEIPALDDFALIRLDLNRANQMYYRRTKGAGPGVQISRAEFDAYLNKRRRAASKLRRVLSGDLPPIVIFDDDTYRIDRKLSVISIFDGVREIKQNPYKADYVKDLGFAYTKNFGIRQGMSGSGVMTNTGELIGVVSASLYLETVRPASKTGKKEQRDYFLFAAFNKPLRACMESVMGSDYYQLDFKDAYPQFIRRGVRGDHRDIRSVVQQIRRDADKKQAGK